MKRVFLFLVTNILVMITISIVARVLGLDTFLTQYGMDYTKLALFSLLWGMTGSVISLMLSKFMAKMSMGVQIVEKNSQYGRLVEAVHHYARKSGITTMPEVGIYESPEVNAFATGPSKNNSLVAVSTGLLDSMTDDEVEGVIAHEVAHIANGDMVTMTLVQGVVNAFVIFFSKIIGNIIGNAMRDDNDRPSQMGYFLGSIISQILFSILGSFVVAYVSRMREYRADSGGAKLAGREKMVAALQRLKRTFDRVDDSVSELASMKISSKGGIMGLLSTHPSLDDRINALMSK